MTPQTMTPPELERSHEESSAEPTIAPTLPDTPVGRWVQPVVRFFRIEAASGIVLLVCTVLALIAANSPWAHEFDELWHTPITIAIGGMTLEHSLAHWITDGLMTIFFFVVGLEIKRELVAGELRDPKKAALPVLGAVGGMIAPALIYLSLEWGVEGAARGWGIPTATDIAFVVALLAVLGPRVPAGLKIMLLSLAIADDIGAVMVIAFFYTDEINVLALMFGFVGFGVTYFFNVIGVRRVPVYVVIGALIWLAFLKSGVHPTIAGVMLGLLTPASAWIGDKALLDVARDMMKRVRGRDDSIDPEHKQESVGQLALVARESVSPLDRLEEALHPWVAFLIIPLFALANVGVEIHASAWQDSIVLAIVLGLLIGKPLGIVAFCWLAVRFGVAKLPTGVNWTIMTGGGVICGIGFTMSLLIASLALSGDHLEAGKIGVLIGSVISAVVGSAILIAATRNRPAVEDELAAELTLEEE